MVNMKVLCFRFLRKIIGNKVIRIHLLFNNASMLNLTNFEKDLIKWFPNLLLITASSSLKSSCMLIVIASCIILIHGIFMSFPIGTVRQLRVIFLKVISIPKYKAHEKIAWPIRMKEHIHTLIFFAGRLAKLPHTTTCFISCWEKDKEIRVIGIVV